MLINENVTYSQLKKLLEERGLDDLSLIQHYIPEFKGINKSINSTLRSDDTNASMHFRYKNGKLQISDFGGGCFGKSIIGYLELHDRISYQEVLNKVYYDFLDSTPIRNLPTIKSSNVKESTDTILRVKRRDFTSNDLEYWGQYYITKEHLIRARIASVEMYWSDNHKGQYKFKIPKSELCFVYPYYNNSKGIFMYKIYRPYHNIKFFSNVDLTVVQNFRSFDKGYKFIWHQSSLKDCLVMEVIGERNIIAPNGEGMWYSPKIWKHFDKNYSNIYFADNDHHKKDNPGIKEARKKKDLYNLDYVTTPKIEGVTDISDYIKATNINEVKDYVDTLKRSIEFFK